MIPSFLKENETYNDDTPRKSRKLLFVDKTTKNMASFIIAAVHNWDSSQKKGLLQQIDVRIKLLSILSFIILVSLIHTIEILLLISFLIFFISIISKIDVWKAYRRIGIITFLFGFLIFVPASLNLFSKGNLLFTIIHLEKEYNWFVYHIPSSIGVTREGVLLVLRLCLKVFNSVSLVTLLISTTSFEQITKGLKILRVPDIFILTLSMSYKYIFIFSQTVIETYQALRMRWWNMNNSSMSGSIIAGRLGFLFQKSWERYEMMYQAMMARGFTGKVKLYYTEKISYRDLVFALSALVLLAFFIFINISYARTI